MVRTGPQGSWALGAADAAGSVLSSVADLARVMALLLSVGLPEKSFARAVPQVVSKATLKEMMSAQMVTTGTWSSVLGMPSPTTESVPSAALAAGLGFDIVGQFPAGSGAAVMRGRAYAEKNGDTVMHKARLGLLLDEGIGVILLSNLGGSVGDQLTALKFGLLSLAAGSTEKEADDVLEQTLDVSDFWNQNFRPTATCTSCGTVLSDSALCIPGNATQPPEPLARFAGVFGDDLHGKDALHLTAAGGRLEVRLGPLKTKLEFGPSHTVVAEPCVALAQRLPPHIAVALDGVAGWCHLVEFRLPGDLPAETGTSELNGTIAFPWGCGLQPLPTTMPIYVIVGTEDAWAWLATADVIFPRVMPSEYALGETVV